MQSKNLRFIAGTLFLAASLSACAPVESNVTTAQTEQNLQRLQAARETDLSNALDIAIGPVASGDYSIRAEKADEVMNEIEHGKYVSQARVNDALFVPPKTISEAQRAQLVYQLEEARAQDNQGWWDWTRDPVIAQDFAVQEIKANRALKDLETHQQVSWSEIAEGLQVPRYP